MKTLPRGTVVAYRDAADRWHPYPAPISIWRWTLRYVLVPALVVGVAWAWASLLMIVGD